MIDCNCKQEGYDDGYGDGYDEGCQEAITVLEKKFKKPFRDLRADWHELKEKLQPLLKPADVKTDRKIKLLNLAFDKLYDSLDTV